MVSVPEQDGFRVGVGQLPGVRADVPQMLDSGAAVSAAGKQAFDAGSDIVKMQLQMAAEANAAMHDLSMSELKDYQIKLRNDKELGYQNLLGRNALERPDGMSLMDEYDALFEQRRQEIRAGLKNEAQRQAFDASAAGLRSSFRAEVSAHMQREHQSFMRETAASLLTSARNAFTAAEGAEEEESALGRMMKQLEHMQQIYGWDNATLEVQARTTITAGAGSRVDYLIDRGRIEDAHAVLDKYGEFMNQDDVLKLRSRIENVYDDETGEAFGEQLAAATFGEGGGVIDVGGSEGVAGDMVMPVQVKGSRISSKFGMRMHPVFKKMKMHTGIDIAAPKGSHIVAAAAGEVIWKGKKGGYGETIMIRHADGKETLYAHMQGYADVKVGSRVSSGQLIGYVGSTGTSTGPHLHYEVRVNGKPVDPSSVKIGGASGKRVSVPKQLTMEQAEQMIKTQLPRNQRAAALRALNRRAQDIKRQQAEAQSQTMAAIVQNIAQNGGSLDGIPKSLMASLDPREQLSVQRFADQWRNGLEDRAFDKNKAWFYDKKANPEKLAELSRDDILAMALEIGYERAQELLRSKDSYEKAVANGETPGLKIQAGVAKHLADMYGIKTGSTATPDDIERYYHFLENVGQLAKDLKASLGREPTYAELVTAAKDMLSEEAVTKQRRLWWDKKQKTLALTKEEQYRVNSINQKSSTQKSSNSDRDWYYR
ncbi:murein DD-endopeptidase MepM/ murein hydrolase activator NlpD [Neisseria sp. HSC-16F19]|nr:peptidoglycan DD-metalloendopeptidase family protein [Neisseria sp. HSC-16F19]MCP2041932.1 murein DD-endopeptidase MepM/ murein hydrolase activator NlpD [Neisseria sp. HSC-16F19]